MKKIEVEIFSSNINSVIIKLPERKYPGVVIQGDSLKIMHNTVLEIKKLCGVEDSSEVSGMFAEILEQLSGYLNVYETTLELNKIELPYNKT
jgi:hypothetical protein